MGDTDTDDGRDRAEKSGRFQEEYASDDVLSLLQEMHPEPAHASEVGERLDTTRRTAYNKLTDLADAGKLQSKKIGARGRVYWYDPELADE